MSKKLLSLLLTIMLVLSVCTVSAFAADSDKPVVNTESDVATVHMYDFDYYNNSLTEGPARSVTAKVGDKLTYEISFYAEGIEEGSFPDATELKVHFNRSTPYVKGAESVKDNNVLKYLSYKNNDLFKGFVFGDAQIDTKGMIFPSSLDERGQERAFDFDNNGKGQHYLTIEFEIAESGDVYMWNYVQALVYTNLDNPRESIDISSLNVLSTAKVTPAPTEPPTLPTEPPTPPTDPPTPPTDPPTPPTDPPTPPTDPPTPPTDPPTPPTDPPTPPQVIGIYGDVTQNGKVDMEDALVMRRHIAKYITIEGDAFLLGDVNFDGVIDLYDVLMVQKHVAAYKIPPVGEEAIRK